MMNRKERKGACPQISLIFADLVLSSDSWVTCGRILQFHISNRRIRCTILRVAFL